MKLYISNSAMIFDVLCIVVDFLVGCQDAGCCKVCIVMRALWWVTVNQLVSFTEEACVSFTTGSFINWPIFKPHSYLLSSLPLKTLNAEEVCNSTNCFKDPHSGLSYYLISYQLH